MRYFFSSPYCEINRFITPISVKLTHAQTFFHGVRVCRYLYDKVSEIMRSVLKPQAKTLF